ncbi:Imidazoleglycerol-phosphate dehydratase [Zea mays]|uniref:Imidazoleglycerol-phosphate dehydratase n=1 Tax=Zea mays TaxID=4577 RepID=A0A3L6G251_MAIZE|nr:Imidazoleglycerol-phosphate dehydratase [Zea mays]
MTTARLVSTSPTRLPSTSASPIHRTSLCAVGRAPAFSARPLGFSLRLKPSPAMAAAGVGGNGPPTAHGDSIGSSRIGEVKRVTKETNVHVKINLDGTGVAECSTGIPFLDHMLDVSSLSAQLASHGLFDVYVKATGDTHIDDHHSNEDIALAIGTALLEALGDRKGINRFGHFTAPLDEAAVEVILDLSGRPHLSCGLDIPTQRVGTYDTQLVEHFFQSVVNTSGMTLHIRQLAGKNSHHIIEASFKAFARALRQATEYDLRRQGTVPRSVFPYSELFSKGVLSRS